ncbi:MAG: lytic transglycosylase domain-containing protein [Eubacteriales bacterium]
MGNTRVSGAVGSWIDQALKNKGVGAEHKPYIAWIIDKESSGNPTAQNPKSTAYGLLQFLDKTWGNYGYQKTSDPVKQVEAGIDYMFKRYGSPQKAFEFWQKKGWY